jgi:hypothetical protein
MRQLKLFELIMVLYLTIIDLYITYFILSDIFMETVFSRIHVKILLIINYLIKHY